MMTDTKEFVHAGGNTFLVIEEVDNQALLIGSVGPKKGEVIIARNLDWDSMSWGSGAYCGRGIDALQAAIEHIRG